MHRVSIIALGVLLSACRSEDTQTVQFYLDNEDARAERLATCEVQDRADEDANCVNARRALTQAKTLETKKMWEDQLEALQPDTTE